MKGYSNSSIIRNIRRGKVDELRKELGKCGSLNLVEEDVRVEESSPLHAAAGLDGAPAEMVKMLLEAGASPDISSPNHGRTPFHLAASRHAIQKMEILRNHGADIHCLATAGYNAMVLAATGPAATLAPVLTLLLEWQVSPNRVSSYGESALSICSRRCLYAAVKRLLGGGADPAPLEWVPLHHAAAFGGLRSEADMIGMCEDVLCEDAWQRTPFHVAVAANDVRAVRLLLGAGSDPFAWWRSGNALHLAATADSADALRLLLDIGLEPDWAVSGFDTPLMSALENDSLESAKVLIAAGADPITQTAISDFPVHRASSPAAFELLLAAGAEVNVISGEGEWPLKSAARNGNAALVRFLLERGALPNLTSTGETALHDTVRADCVETASLLLDAGCDPNAQDVDGWTPLFCLRSPEMARMLLSRGANSQLGDSAGMMASDWVKDPDVLEALRS